MNSKRSEFPSIVTPSGTVVVFGGLTGSVVAEPCTNTIEEYNPATDTWTIIGTMVTERRRHAARLIDDSVYSSSEVPARIGLQFQQPKTLAWRATQPRKFTIYRNHAMNRRKQSASQESPQFRSLPFGRTKPSRIFVIPDARIRV